MLTKIFKRRKNEPNTPVAIQCLWDTDYTFIELQVDLIFHSNNSYRKERIETIEIKDYKSKKEMVKMGNKIANLYSTEYNIEIYFPSPDDWSRNCPNWWKKDSSLRCLDCNTPIISNKSKIPTIITCAPCQLNRSRNDEIKRNILIDGGVSIYIVGHQHEEKIWYSTNINSVSYTHLTLPTIHLV